MNSSMNHSSAQAPGLQAQVLCRRYCGRVKRSLFCPAALRRPVLSQLEESVLLYLEEHPRAGMNELCAHFVGALRRINPIALLALNLVRQVFRGDPHFGARVRHRGDFRGRAPSALARHTLLLNGQFTIIVKAWALEATSGTRRT